jgi:hypothetical protein
MLVSAANQRDAIHIQSLAASDGLRTTDPNEVVFGGPTVFVLGSM